LYILQSEGILDVGSTPTWSTKSIFFEVLVVTCVAKTATEYASDGPDMVSTGWNNGDGNTVGDDRKSSKTINANDEKFALAA